MALPIVYTNGLLNELPILSGVAPAPRVIASPVLGDVGDGEMTYDSIGNRLVLRTGDFLQFFYPSNELLSTPSELDFSNPDNSFWGVFMA